MPCPTALPDEPTHLVGPLPIPATLAAYSPCWSDPGSFVRRRSFRTLRLRRRRVYAERVAAAGAFCCARCLLPSHLPVPRLLRFSAPLLCAPALRRACLDIHTTPVPVTFLFACRLPVNPSRLVTVCTPGTRHFLSWLRCGKRCAAALGILLLPSATDATCLPSYLLPRRICCTLRGIHAVLGSCRLRWRRLHLRGFSAPALCASACGDAAHALPLRTFSCILPSPLSALLLLRFRHCCTYACLRRVLDSRSSPARTIHATGERWLVCFHLACYAAR